ncbi:MAG TPA: hypothetical protein VFX97_20660 [Pyrinomonadaceae bacterium]|nr:hypothetical protein [Pyrinomonadaceae bacterium]
MVAFTANRNYPYSQSTDDADVAGDIEALARAIDLDMAAVMASVLPRRMARVRNLSTVKQFFPASVQTELTFDFVDVDNAGIVDLGSFNTRMTPTSAGLWCVWGAIEVPNAFANGDEFMIRKNGLELTRYTPHDDDPQGETVMRTICSVGTANGTTDYFSLTFNPIAATSEYRISNKHMACFRLTNT